MLTYPSSLDRYSRIPLEEIICQLCHHGVEFEEQYVCYYSVFYEISGRYHCLFKQGVHPQCKVMEYEDQWCLELFFAGTPETQGKVFDGQ